MGLVVISSGVEPNHCSLSPVQPTTLVCIHCVRFGAIGDEDGLKGVQLERLGMNEGMLLVYCHALYQVSTVEFQQLEPRLTEEDHHAAILRIMFTMSLHCIYNYVV